ncbi:MAG: hypothetical protein KKG76_14120 [Euryarchaeota archaeon]|nr:hypothetical protein [Euryarchaeota archaeon]
MNNGGSNKFHNLATWLFEEHAVDVYHFYPNMSVDTNLRQSFLNLDSKKLYGFMVNQRLTIYLYIFSVSVAMLILQVSFIRILSVAQWYHFAFLVISIALFGMGAAGTFLSVYPEIMKRELTQLIRSLTFVFSLSIVVSFLLVNNIPFDPFRITWDRMQLLYIMVYYVVLSVPFFFAGMIITIALSRMEDVGRIYFSSLLGAALGSIMVIPLSVLGAKTVGLAAIIAALFIPVSRNKRKLSLVFLGLLLLMTLYFPQINISPYKSLSIALSYPDSELLYTQWDAHSRVDVMTGPMVRYAPGLSYTYQGNIPEQLGITVDGDRLTAITRWDGNTSSLTFIDYLPTSLPFHLNRGKTLILETGGGLDILAALYYNATPITAVEPNRMISGLMTRYGDFSGHLYEKANIEVSESRSFARRSKEKYDVILLSLTGTSPASTGIYALSENYVYTVEAFQDYMDRLSENGVLSITRYVLPPPRESVRIVSVAIEAMEKNGIKQPEEHIAVIRSWGTITILIKKSRLTQEDITKLKEFSRDRRFDLVYLPGITIEETNVFNRFPEPYYYQEISMLFRDRKTFYNEYLFDVSPVTDERPFFFHFFKVGKIVPTYESMGRKWQPFIEGGYLVPVIFLEALVLSLVFILLPLKKLGKYQYKKGILVYFLCLGLGFMFVEIIFIQKFILFLGNPIYAMSAVLFSLLLFAGLGSFYSERLKDPSKIIIALSFLIILYLIALPSVFNILLGQQVITRYMMSLLIIAPLGFLMGMPFPLGIRMAKRISPDLIPWAWAVNGCASVLGSILVIMVALSYGFSTVLILAAVAYMTALLFMLSSGLLRLEERT